MSKSWIFAILLIGFLIAAVSAVPTGNQDDYNQDEYHREDANVDGDPDTEEEDDESEEADRAYITSKPMTVDVDVGGDFTLECQGDPDGWAVMWEKEKGANNTEVLFVQEVRVTSDTRINTLKNNTQLVVKDVIPSDAGKYICRYSTPITKQVVHTVNVRLPPRVSVDSSVRIVKHGEPATLACNVTGYPKPTVSWERKNKRMPNGEMKTEGSMITFEAVSRHHAGIYECFAENEIGSARTAVNLQILYPPEIETEAETVSTGQGFNADLVCLVHAEPKATVVWYKEGRPVESDKHEAVERMSHKFILHVKGVTEKDFGDYQCVASNSLGRNNKNIVLSGTPSQPVIQSEKSGHGKDPHSYNLVWEFQSHTPADTTKLKYKKAEDEDWMETEVTPAGNSPHLYTASFTLQDLTPSTDYVATLQAHNSYGWSKAAQVHEFHVNGNDIQSQEAETEPGAKAVESVSGGASVVSCSLFALFLTTLTSLALRW